MANGKASLTLEQLWMARLAVHYMWGAGVDPERVSEVDGILVAAIAKAERVEHDDPLSRLMAEIAAEVSRARSLFPPMHSPHEALAVILEEFDEYKHEVWNHNPAKGRDTRPSQRAELIQLCAMGARAILDTISESSPLPEADNVD